MTKLILNPFISPSFNLALEEYLLTEFSEGDIIMLWRNSPSVIVGKNQNSYAEIDLDFVTENKIPVIRRLTGGGAVFHDLGNINYTFISDYKSGDLGGFARFASPVCDFLAQMGINAQLSGRNDITVDGIKISGTAKTVKGGRSLAHGTLLYDADLSNLSKALRPNLKKLEDKAVRSVKSRVCNIKEIANCPLSAQMFMEKLGDFFLKAPDTRLYELDNADISAVKQIEEARYSRWEWNFALSPDFSFKTEKKYPFGIVECHLNIEEGRISDIRFIGDFFGSESVEKLEEHLKSVKFTRSDLSQRLSAVSVSDFISGMTDSLLLDLILSAKK